jgi:P-type Mg2+ transporter
MWFLFRCRNLGLVPPPEVAGRFIHSAAAGPDYTYAAALFQSGWFVESILTQTLIIHVIRTNKIPFIQSRASWQLTITTGAIMLVGMWLPSSPIGQWLGLVPLPMLYWPFLLLTLLLYVVLTQGVKEWLIRRNWL